MATPLLFPCTHSPQYSSRVSVKKNRNDRNLFNSISVNPTFHLNVKSNSVSPLDICDSSSNSPDCSRSSSMSPSSTIGSPHSSLPSPQSTNFIKRSPSSLIIPSWMNYFLPNNITRPKRSNSRLYKLGNTSYSSVSLTGDRKVPEVVIRKSNTSVALVDPSLPTTKTTTIREPKKKKTVFRKLATSKSAILSDNPAAFIRKSSSSSFCSDTLNDEETLAPLPEKISSCSRCPSTYSLYASRSLKNISEEMLYCKLCLQELPISEMYQLRDCQCRFCKLCLAAYLEVLINDGGGFLITCPDADCSCDGEFTKEDIDLLCSPNIRKKYNKNRLETDVILDRRKAWCIKPNCETLVEMTEPRVMNRASMAVCPKCQTVFCASCQSPMHIRELCVDSPAYGNADLENGLKRCPRCNVYIERDSGCAQMQCKLCKHVFCWYCLVSLEDDFLLRHYDKGPCKNKLGHSRASVLWHRAQVILIFASFGVLLVAASPLLLFVGPCLVCRRCCNWCVFKNRIQRQIN